MLAVATMLRQLAAEHVAALVVRRRLRRLSRSVAIAEAMLDSITHEEWGN